MKIKQSQSKCFLRMTFLGACRNMDVLIKTHSQPEIIVIEKSHQTTITFSTNFFSKPHTLFHYISQLLKRNNLYEKSIRLNLTLRSDAWPGIRTCARVLWWMSAFLPRSYIFIIWLIIFVWNNNEFSLVLHQSAGSYRCGRKW